MKEPLFEIKFKLDEPLFSVANQEGTVLIKEATKEIADNFLQAWSALPWTEDPEIGDIFISPHGFLYLIRH